ncbi:hypothetical protein TNCV_3385361 [Trichonephila clavipes]|uniref:Uncharacterized protein n=1 Tax=Trichonephila clavipes TaxID=2585209 RepID=A0A8X6SVA2_TRICX|nr:hypothetical protein TNCV_3385361 [Trichonephila clavipes]
MTLVTSTKKPVTFSGEGRLALSLNVPVRKLKLETSMAVLSLLLQVSNTISPRSTPRRMAGFGVDSVHCPKKLFEILDAPVWSQGPAC